MGRTRAHQGEIASAGASGPQRVTDRLGRLRLVTFEAARLGGAPFVIPDLETADVKLKGFLPGGTSVIARFPVAWTTPDPCDAVMW